MKYIALVVLLSIMQASPPVPRKAADNSSHATADTNDKSAPHQELGRSQQTVSETDRSRPAKSDSRAPGTNNPNHDVRITEIPNVTVNPAKRDAADWGYWAFSLLLVIVGFFQVLLLFGTLKAIQRQAALMERQINKERPRIRVEVQPFALQPVESADEADAVQVVKYTVTCYGFTHAFIEQEYFCAELKDTADWEAIPDMVLGGSKSSAVIAPNSVPDNREEPFLLTDFEIKSVEHKKSFIHFSGIIKYRDFSETERETTVSFVWSAMGTKKPRPVGLGRWEKIGPPEANHET
jgi:hypothetical protein